MTTTTLFIDKSCVKTYDSFMKTKTYSASAARTDLFNIIKQVSRGQNLVEITQRSGQSAVLMSKEEYEAWQETMNIFSSKNLLKQIKQALAQSNKYSHQQVLVKLSLKNEDLL